MFQLELHATVEEFAGAEGTVREYANGTFGAATALNLMSPLFATFGEAAAWLSDQSDEMDAPSDWDAGTVCFDPYV